jgi:hypothetical protein
MSNNINLDREQLECIETNCGKIVGFEFHQKEDRFRMLASMERRMESRR